MSENFVQHHVRPGQTLSGIARQYGVRLQDLLNANPEIHNPDRITVGQTITIPQPDDAPATPLAVPAETVPAHAPDAADPNALLYQYQPRGASNATSRQDGLPQRGISGVQASETMAETDQRRVMRCKDSFQEAARRFHLPPALLAAIASRESRGGSVLKNGFGDNGHGFGLMQVDDRNPFAVITTGGPFGQPHINQATGILRDKLEAVQQQFPDLSEVEQLETAVSRYNGGDGRPAPNSDQGTTGNDYMNDVWARALYYARAEEWNGSRSATGASATPLSPTAFDRQPDHFMPAPSLADVQEGRDVLQFGQEGDAVRHVQQLLGIGRDGEFGINTRKAVMAFQRANQVTVLGHVDSATLEALERADKTDWAVALDRIDPREKTPRAHPELRRCLGLMAQALAGRDMQVMITDGLRTFAEQDALFAIGRRGRPGERIVTNARGGLSNHNYGLAVDLYPVIDGRVHTAIPANASQDFRNRFTAIQQAIGAEAERVGLTWGGRWTSPVDMPHVQLLEQDNLPPRDALEIYRAHDNSIQAVWDEATRRFHRQ